MSDPAAGGSNDEHPSPGSLRQIALGVVIAVLAYQLWIGITIQKIGIPGVLDLSFGERSERIGLFAINRNNLMQFGAALGNSQESVEATAVGRCGAPGCVVVDWILKGECLAYVVTTDGEHSLWQKAYTEPVARRAAVTECHRRWGECVDVVGFCNSD